MREALGADSAYTTILSTLQQLERVGWVTHRRQGRRHLYRAALSRSEAERAALVSLLSDELAGAEHLIPRLPGGTLSTAVDFRRGRKELR